jgi:hypothetical protein
MIEMKMFILGVIICGSVWFLLKKITKLKLKKKTKKPKPNRNWFKPTGFSSVRFFRTKTGSNRFDSVFSDLAHFFSVLARFFFVWLGFGSFFSDFFRFGFGSVFSVSGLKN